MSKIVIEIDDKECLQYLIMLKALEEQLEQSGNTNDLLAGGVSSLHGVLQTNFLKQTTVDRIKELK